MDANAKEGPYNEDIKRAVRWLKGRGLIDKDKDIGDKTGYRKSTVSGYVKGRIVASSDFRTKFEEAFKLKLADFESEPEPDTPTNVTGDPTVQYGANQSNSSSINIKTVSGETIAVVAVKPNEIKLLNLFLEERERLISQIEKENEKLTRIIDSGLIEIKSHLKEALDGLNTIENGQQVQHSVMLHSLERLEKKEPGTFEKELNTLKKALTNENADQQQKDDLNR